MLGKSKCVAVSEAEMFFVAAGYRMSVPGGAGGAVGAGAGWGGAPQPLMYSAAAMPSAQYPSQ